MTHIQILGTGRALPARKLTRADLSAAFDLDARVVAAGPPVEARYFCAQENQIDLAQRATERALEAAGRAAQDIDLIISACAVPYQPIPTTAPLILRQLGVADGAAAAFDVNATCLSFVTGLNTAAQLVATGAHRCAVVVSSEVASRALPWQSDPHTAMLFGDGAGAVVIGQGSGAPGGSRVLASDMRCFPSAFEASRIVAGGTRLNVHADPEGFARSAVFEMDGRALFRITAQHFKEFLDGLLAQAGWRPQDVDLVVPHQASPQALAHMIRVAGFAPSRVVDITGTVGNQIAASIPFALDHAARDGRLRRGDKVLLLGTSAGVSIGGMALVY